MCDEQEVDDSTSERLRKAPQHSDVDLMLRGRPRIILLDGGIPPATPLPTKYRGPEALRHCLATVLPRELAYWAREPTAHRQYRLLPAEVFTKEPMVSRSSWRPRCDAELKSPLKQLSSTDRCLAASSNSCEFNRARRGHDWCSIGASTGQQFTLLTLKSPLGPRSRGSGGPAIRRSRTLTLGPLGVAAGLE